MPLIRTLLLLLFLSSIYSLAFSTNSSIPFQYLSIVNQFCFSSEDCAQGALLCINSTCQFCSPTQFCELQPTYVCSLNYFYENATVGVCQVKSLFPLAWNDITSSAICFIGGAVAASAGIGGGGIFIPLFCLQNIRFPSTHPQSKSRPLIDYHFTLLTLPILLCGAVVGILLNSVLPNWAIIVILFVSLLFAALKSIQKGIQITRKLQQQANSDKIKTELELQESVQEKQNEAEDSVVEIQSDNLTHVETPIASEEPLELPTIPEDEEQKLTANDALATTINNTSPTLQEKPVEFIVGEELETNTLKSKKTALDWFLQLDDSRFPIHIWIPLLLIWCLVSMLSFLRGSKSSPSILGIIPCSWQYWLVLGIQFPVLISITICIGVIFKLLHSWKQKRGAVFLSGQLQYHQWHTALGIPMLFFFIGMLGSMIGLGGGMFASPVLLSMGQDPSVVVATSALMVLFSAAISVVQFLVIGRLPLDYTLWFFLLGLLSGLLGQSMIGFLIKKFNKTHWIVFIVASVILVSGFATTALGVYQTVLDIILQKPMGFKSLCS